MSKIVCGELEIPCPYCTDGFTTAGDRHTRTKQDVCKHCGGTGKAPAGTGKTAATSAPPLNISSPPLLSAEGARIDRIERQMKEHGEVDSQDLEWMAKGVRRAIRFACAGFAPLAMTPGKELAELPNSLTVEMLMQLAYDMGYSAGTLVQVPASGTYFDRRREAVAALITDVEKAGHMPVVEVPQPSVLPGARFGVTDKVIKNRGDYWWSGVVLAAFYLPGTELVRYVVAHKVEKGHVLHIYSDAQLELLVVDDE